MRLEKKISKGLRMQIYAWSALVGVLLMIGITFAWYSQQKREAETEIGTVMKPYYLTLLNPSESAALQLSVGSILQGQTKQIVFCVSSEDDSQTNRNPSIFTYDLELVHTDNLALKYEIYPLEKKDETVAGEDNIIVAEDIVTEDGATVTKTTYWKKSGEALSGKNVSEERWKQVGLVEADVSEGEASGGDTSGGDIINRGTYISYKEAGNTENGSTQYFVLEMEWNITTGFEKYEKETDMIYLLAKAVQPEPVVQ